MYDFSCLILSITLLAFLTPADTFNVGTSGARVLKGTEGSHFGATLNFLPRASKLKDPGEIALLVSAPYQSGAVPNKNSTLGRAFVCKDILSSSYSCTPIYKVDTIGDKLASTEERFGSAVAVNENGAHVICSPGWRDNTAWLYHYTFQPGRCSVITSDTGDGRDYTPYFNKFARSNYVSKVGERTVYNQATAMYGVSVDTKKGDFYVAGAPGVLEGEGTIALTDMKEGVVTKAFVEKRLNHDTTAFGYLGYSIKIGNFCEESDVCFAVSAPNLNRVGVVKIMKRSQPVYNFKTTQLIIGQQAWAYFGYAVAACDVNRDDLDELLVGAPYYSDTTDVLQGHDQGRVYVYTRPNYQEELKVSVVLEGGRAKFSRFGATIQCIGDINLDTYKDVAVGAPGEDDGAGSVYIYLGSPSGLSKQFNQHIKASALPSSITGLGYAISGSQKISGSGYPVFAVSSIQSDTVVVLNTRPVVDVLVRFNANPNPVDIEVACADAAIPGSCFTVDLCLSGAVRGGGSWDKLFKISLEVDTKKAVGRKRALFRLADGSLTESIPETIVDSETTSCVTYTAVIIETQVNQDRFSPVNIVVNFGLASSTADNNLPVLDAMVPQYAIETVTFKNDCGDNNKCEVDLSVTGKLGYTGHEREWKSLVVNESKELQVDLTIMNSEETNYWTVVEISVNAALPFTRPTPSSDASVICQTDTQVADEASIKPKESKVICNYYKPLERGGTINVGVAFDTYILPLDMSSLTVKAKVMPKNNITTEEMEPSDNMIELMTDVRIIAYVTVDGISSPSEITIQDAKRISVDGKADISEGYTVPDDDPKELDITHKILVQNEGPSLLPPTAVRVSVPFFLTDATLLVHKGDVKITLGKERVSACKALINFDSLDRVVQTTPSATMATDSSDNKATTKSTGGNGATDATTHSSREEQTTVDNGGLPPIDPNRRRRRSVGSRRRRSASDAEEGISSNIYVQSCKLDHQYCQIFECSLPEGLAPDSHAEVNVSLVVDKGNIPVPEGFNTFYYAIHAEVVEPKYDIFQRWEKPSATDSVTKFYLVESGGKINIWIIIGSVIGGLLLITIVAIILWKAGFFKRNKHQQVAQWKRESMRKSRVVSGAGPNGNKKGSD